MINLGKDPSFLHDEPLYAFLVPLNAKTAYIGFMMIIILRCAPIEKEDVGVIFAKLIS